MEKEKCPVTVMELMILVLIAPCQWAAAFHVGVPFQESAQQASEISGSGLGITVPSPRTHPPFFQDFSKNYILQNGVPELNDKNLQNNDKEIYFDIFAKRVLESIKKLTTYANSENDLKRWKEEPVSSELTLTEDFGSTKKKRTSQPPTTEEHVGGCTAIKHWTGLGDGHYPRYLLNYTCTSSTCYSFGECRPKLYAVKVLKNYSVELAEEDRDKNVPEELRCHWRLETKWVATYCECVRPKNGLW